MAHLFEPLTIRSTTFRNRVGMSPMCMYSADEGVPTDWHLAHLGARAVGGVGLVLTEATAVEPRGRISPRDTGIWSDGQATAWRRIAAFLESCGAVPGIQLAHAGRKAGTAVPERGGKPLGDAEGGWEPVAPSALPFARGYRTPRELTGSDLDELVEAWTAAAGRARAAGFVVAELHMAHGYLLHQFLSPLTNRREDEYGGSLENRMSFPLRVARAVRGAWPEEHPLLVRISATDWVPGGWDVDQSVAFVRELAAAGVDLVDCSSGGAVAGASIPAGPGYQVPFAEALRRGAGLPTAAVGLVTEAAPADAIVREEKADLVLLGRELLRNPYWTLQAASELGHEPPWPGQYLRAVPADRPPSIP
jgi:2,4-dienoyl-CoA reductase-like NADH-dependent reductase (Old Yellow Enzyme family)